MIILTSSNKARKLASKIPELALERMIQFDGDGYEPERDCYIVVVEECDDIEHDFPIVGPQGLLEVSGDNEMALFEYVFVVKDSFEAVVQINNEKTVAFVIPDMPWLDLRLRTVLIREAQVES